MSQPGYYDVVAALDVAQKIVRLCHAREIPIPSFEVEPSWSTPVEVKWWPQIERYEVSTKDVEEAFLFTFDPVDSLGNLEAVTTIDDIEVSFTIFDADAKRA